MTAKIPLIAVCAALIGAMLAACTPSNSTAQEAASASSAEAQYWASVSAQAADASRASASASWSAAMASAEAEVSGEVRSTSVDQLRSLAIRWEIDTSSADALALARSRWANQYLDSLAQAQTQYNAKAAECSRIEAAIRAANPGDLSAPINAYYACLAQP